MNAHPQQFDFNCPKHGSQIARYTARCPLCREEERAESEKREKLKRIAECVARASIPLEYAWLPIDKIKPTIREWIEKMPGHEPLTLIGISGNGKSTQASAAILELARREIFATRRECSRTIAALIAAEGEQGERSFGQALNELIRPRVLLLDDYGIYPEWKSQQIRAIVEERTAARLPTIITTNLTVDQFTTQNLSSAQIWSRMTRDGYIVEFTNPSFRVPRKVARE